MISAFLCMALVQEDAVEKAIKKHDQAVLVAKTEFDNKVKTERGKLITALKDELKKSVAKGDVPLFQKITAKLDELDAEGGLAMPDNKDGLVAGLLVHEYPRSDLQEAKKFIPLNQLGESIGEPYVIKDLKHWTHNKERTAVARGFIKITKGGEYGFNSRSFYEYDQLFISGKEICVFGESDPIKRVVLQPGTYPFVSVAWYFGGRDYVEVKWMPPGAKELQLIPDEGVLFHKPVPVK